MSLSSAGMLLQGCKDVRQGSSQTGRHFRETQAIQRRCLPPDQPKPHASCPGKRQTVSNPSLSNTSYAGAPASIAPAPLAQTPNTSVLPAAKSTDLGPPAAPGEAKEYVIAKGDTLAVIAHRNGLSLKALMEANPNVNAKKLQIGQKVQIPAATTAVAAAGAKEAAPGVNAEATAAEGGVYVVKTGDILLKIAKTHGTTVKKIMAMNDLKSTSIRAGQKLKLPAAKTSAAETIAAPATASVTSLPTVTPTRVSSTTPVTGSPVAAN